MTLEAPYRAQCERASDINEHLPTLVALVEELEATKVIELGTRGGCSTVAWLYALEDRGHLWSVDISPRPDLGDYEHWTFVQGDDCHADVLDQLPDEVDAVFIDTSHAFGHTLRELELYTPLVRVGGRVVLHDTELRWPEAIEQTCPFPVREAIDRYCEQHGLSWTNHTNNNGLGIVEVA